MEKFNTTVGVKYENSFYNAITFSLLTPDDKKRSIKVFVNGVLHITGSPNLDEVMFISDVFCGLLHLAIMPTASIRVLDFSIQLLNSNFNIGHGINLESLCDTVSKSTDFLVVYDVERHMGINIKFKVADRVITIIVFQTGNILMTGIKDPDDLFDAYKFITCFIRDHYDKLIHNVGICGKRKKGTFDYGKYIELV